VRHARRTAEVVLENVDLPVLVSDEIGPGNMAPDAERRLETDALPAETPGRLKDFGRHHAVLDDFLFVVDVVDEQIERTDALLQAALDHHPVRCRYNPRQQIERKDAFGAGAVA